MEAPALAALPETKVLCQPRRPSARAGALVMQAEGRRREKGKEILLPLSAET